MDTPAENPERKSLSERIAERNKTAPRSEYAKHRAEFFVARDEIETALSDQWPAKAIWQTLHAEGAFTGSYATFLRQAKRHGLIAPKPDKKRPQRPVGTGPGAQKDAQQEARRAFIFDPRPNPDELVG